MTENVETTSEDFSDETPPEQATIDDLVDSTGIVLSEVLRAASVLSSQLADMTGQIERIADTLESGVVVYVGETVDEEEPEEPPVEPEEPVEEPEEPVDPPVEPEEPVGAETMKPVDIQSIKLNGSTIVATFRQNPDEPYKGPSYFIGFLTKVGDESFLEKASSIDDTTAKFHNVEPGVYFVELNQVNSDTSDYSKTARRRIEVK